MERVTWIEILDDLEARVVAGETALDNDKSLPTDPFVPPTNIEPFPSALHDRALSILSRQMELQQRVETIKQAISRELVVTTRANRIGSMFGDAKQSSFVDSKA